MPIELLTLSAYFCIYAVGHFVITAFSDSIEDMGYKELFRAIDVGFIAGMVIYTVLILMEIFK